MLPDNYSGGEGGGGAVLPLHIISCTCMGHYFTPWMLSKLSGKQKSIRGRLPPHPPTSSVSSYTYVEYQEMLFRSGLLSSYVCNLHMSS